MIDWGWIVDHLDGLAGRTAQHLYLSALAVAIGFGISFALAVWSIRRRVVYGPIVGIAGLLYTIPSLALFPILVPLTGLSDATAEVPLILYSLLIFIRNIVAGFDSVPAEVVEAADGIGYTTRGRFWRIELPLAIPLVVAGIRLASVSTIGLVTITGILGDRFGGLGFFVFEGLRHDFVTEIFAGALASILLAVLVDQVLVAFQRRLTPWSQGRSQPVTRPAARSVST